METGIREREAAMGQDVLGLPADEAREHLAQQGLQVRKLVTAPPGRPLESGVWRVVQQHQAGAGEVLLVIARFPTLAPPEG
jgi:hypothetical protein